MTRLVFRLPDGSIWTVPYDTYLTAAEIPSGARPITRAALIAQRARRRQRS